MVLLVLTALDNHDGRDLWKKTAALKVLDE